MRPLAHSHTQTHRPQRLGHARTSDIKRNDCEDRPQSLRRRPQFRHSTNAQSLFCNHGGISMSYLSRSSAGSRSSADNGTSPGRRECSTHGLGDRTPYTTALIIVVQVHTSPHSSLTSRTATSSRYDHRPSSDRSKSNSPIGPPYLSVDPPTINPSAAPNRQKTTRSHQINPETPTPNPPSECQHLSTFSPHSRSSSSKSIAPPSPTPRRPRRVLDSYHVRRWQGAHSRVGEELTTAEMTML